MSIERTNAMLTAKALFGYGLAVGVTLTLVFTAVSAGFQNLQGIVTPMYWGYGIVGLAWIASFINFCAALCKHKQEITVEPTPDRKLYAL